jgi:predicted dehydrogenase
MATPLLTVFGTDGTLSLRTEAADGQIQMSRLSLAGRRRDGPVEDLVPPPSPCPIDGDDLSEAAFSVAHMYAALRDSWQGPSLPTPTFEDAVAVHRLIDAIQRASDERCCVTL